MDFFVVLFAIWLVFRFLSDRLDRARLRGHMVSIGYDVTEIRWAPFGPGWFGPPGDRIYLITYTDARGETFSSFVKTSLTTGIFFTYNRPAEAVQRAVDELTRLREENSQLRSELEALRGPSSTAS